MTNEIGYLTDPKGEPSAVVIPIDLWRRIFPEEIVSTESMVEKIEDYCLNRAMDEALLTPLVEREAAIAFLEEDSD